MKTLKLTALAAALAAAVSFHPTLMAQDAPKPDAPKSDAPKPERGGDRRGGTPEEFRQRMAERLKESLKATDEEWTVIQPLLDKVTTKQREAGGSRFGGFGGGGRRGGGDAPSGGEQAPRPGQAESTALRTALENEATSADDLKAKMAALREFRKKSAAELATAREDLRKVLTVRQEATLVSAGILE
jgi:hypothetical protein